MDEIIMPSGDRATVLRKFSTIANAVAEHHLSDKNFMHAIRFAREQKMVDSKSLAAIGHTDEATAQKWFDGTEAPDAQMQKTVLKKIADDSIAEALHLVQGKKPDKSN